MNVRLVFAIISTLLEGAALVVIVLLVLPRFGIYLPLPGLLTLVAVWAVIAVIVYRIGSRALRKRPTVGLPAMVGSRGKVVTPLAPEGMVRIKGELWEAKSAHGNIDTGEKVLVVGQDGLRLIVGKNGIDDGGLSDTR